MFTEYMEDFPVTGFFGETLQVAGIIAACVGVFTLAASVLVLKGVIGRRERSGYDGGAHEAMLSFARQSYESRIQELNMRLMATEERWKEVNHLLLDKSEDEPEVFGDPNISTSRFLTEIGLNPKELTVDPRLVFVITPFNERERPVFKVIADVCSRIGFHAVRGDEGFVPGDILPHVVRLIAQSRFVVANISGRNPNVYYELGIAHALGKPVILISRTIDEVMFDLRSKRVILFDNRAVLAERLKDALARALAG